MRYHALLYALRAGPGQFDGIIGNAGWQWYGYGCWPVLGVRFSHAVAMRFMAGKSTAAQ